MAGDHDPPSMPEFGFLDLVKVGKMVHVHDCDSSITYVYVSRR